MTNLITFAYLRSVTDISGNVDDKFLQPKLKMAQDQLKFLIGRDFYNALVTAYQPNNTQTPFSDASYQALYDPYIKEFLAFQTNEYYLAKANATDTRAGLRTFKEDNSDPISDKMYGTLMSMAKEQVQSYKGAMILFITETQKNDSTKYRLYRDKWSSNKMGSSFGITKVKARTADYSKINERTTMNDLLPDNQPSFEWHGNR